MKRTIVISDIHGCSVELKELLEKLKLTENDAVYSVGDILDKSSAERQIETLDLCLKYNIINIEGNHDNKQNRWRKHEKNKELTGKNNPMTSVSETNLEVYRMMTPEHIEYLDKAPATIMLNEQNTMLVHGGLLPLASVPLEKQLKKRRSEIMRLRWLDNDTLKFVPLIGSLDQPPHTTLWSQLWDGPFNVVYGHIAHSLTDPRIDVREDGIKTVGIDTGCVIGGRLTAYVLETEEVIQVQSKELYCSENPEEM